MKNNIIPYKQYLVPIARRLRKRMTLSEVLLWKRIKGRQIKGYDFDRQKPIDKYIVDFYCKDLNLAIEIDGISHDLVESIKYDFIRQKKLESLGVKFIRIDDKNVKCNINGVVADIIFWIKENE